jgi:xylose isomerase
MRTYLILKEKAARWNADGEIQAIVKDIHQASMPTPAEATYSSAHLATLLGVTFNRGTLAAKNLPYERLDQLTVEVLLGAR